MISDYVPCFIKEIVRKRRINKQFGKYNNISTTTIHPTATIGHNVYLARNTDIRKDVRIGNYSYCSSGSILFNATTVGNFCSIGYNVQIGCPEHPIGFMSTSPYVYRNDQIKKYCKWPSDDIKNPVVIGHDVWIGSNVVVLQGCHIGNGAVIAAGAVVTKDVPPYEVWGGGTSKIYKKEVQR